MKYSTKKQLSGFITAGLMLASAQTAFANDPKIINGPDNNSALNALIQPEDPALSGEGRDQSLQFGDILFGTNRSDIINGRLGADLMYGRRGNDVILGGLEHFNTFSRIDRAFGNRGSDIFIWKPGDGSDSWDGGKGADALIFGLTGEVVNGEVDFTVIRDQKAGELYINPHTGLPMVDVTKSPGFCEVISKSDSEEAREELQQLDLDNLVRFVLRGVRDAFEAGEQDIDNGVRVTLHTKSVEYVVCTSRETGDEGGQIEVIDLTGDFPRIINLHDIRSRRLRNRLQDIVF